MSFENNIKGWVNINNEIKKVNELLKLKREKKINPDSVVWQNIETDYWKNILKNLVIEHFNETKSQLSKKLIDNFSLELNNFVQVCPKEMLDKLENPISFKQIIKEVV